MVRAAKDLPENIDALKQLVSAKEQMLLEKDQRIAVLEEQLQLLMHKRFGASSEKASLDQLHLFNEAEATTEQLSEAPAADAAETIVPEHKRKRRRGSRRPRRRWNETFKKPVVAEASQRLYVACSPPYKHFVRALSRARLTS